MPREQPTTGQNLSYLEEAPQRIAEITGEQDAEQLRNRPESEPPVSGDEAETLLGFLERQRATFAWKCGELDAAGLQATLDPSSMTLGGLLKHLARFEDDMSTEWLLGQEQLPPWNNVDWNTDHDWHWRTAADESPDELYQRWTSAVDRSRSRFAEALASNRLDLPGTGNADDAGRLPSLRYILLNMIEEYARHNGHADLIRESIDGLTGQDPPD
ncbi:MAG: DinB family protein [Thermomicrobiales bacterium]